MLGERRSEILEVVFSESHNILFDIHVQIFKEYKMSIKVSRRNTGNYVEITCIYAILPEGIKEIDVYED